MSLVAACLALISSGCEKHEVQQWFSQAKQPPNEAPSELLFQDKPLEEALAALRKSVKGPIQALSLLIYPDHIVLQAQDTTRPDHVDQYVYRNGSVSAPVAVKLMGEGKLDDNLFPLQAARLEAVPDLVRAARKKIDIPEGKVTRVLLKRNLPESMDIQFRVYVTSQRRDGHVDADKNGTILDEKR